MSMELLFTSKPEYVAGSDEFLVIEFKDGRKEHIPGPKSVHFSSKDHKSIAVRQAITIPNGYAIVVFSNTDGKVSRRIIQGPGQYIPKSNEWLHTFFWWIPNQTGVASAKNRKLLRFKKLRIIPDQLYFDVTDVRTRDDALLTISLMIFYQLQDIDKMLENTHDPVLELINSVTADVINFANQRTFDQFKMESEKLNLLESYPLTSQKFPRLGYEVSKIVYRGYLAGQKLQDMHNSAIEARTALQLQNEKVNQEQDIEDLKLQRMIERKAKERQLAQEQTEHEVRMKSLLDEEALRHQRAQHDEAMRQQQVEKEKLLEYNVKDSELQSKKQQQTMTNQLEFYKKLHKDVNVNVTQYLVSQNQHPDKLIQVVTGQQQNADATPIHVHSS